MLLCFDLASSGISAALLNSRLEVSRSLKIPWTLTPGESGEATLSVDEITARFKQVVRDLRITEALDAICMATFMHNCVLLDAAGKPLTPLFTWLDRRGEEGLALVRSRIGERFHERTGCRYHPMYPVFKLAALRVKGSPILSEARRAVSIKSFLVHALTGVWIEDYGMASASGLFNIQANDWDSEVLEILDLDPQLLAPIAPRTSIAGEITRAAAADFGLPERARVINGSGDGFLAHLGSDCEKPGNISVSLGTSAVARQSLAHPILENSAGTFCYVADRDTYLLGCAGNNGGNVLDWGRSIFGELPSSSLNNEVPIFVPLLHGERSPEWNSQARGSWHNLTAQHTKMDLAQSILEGVVFNLAYFIEILRTTSRTPASSLVLSGNGFLQPFTASLLAATVDIPVSMPADPGLLSLRGAAACALRALEQDVPALALQPVAPLADEHARQRFKKYKDIRPHLC